jgi:hypothetical protein
MTGGGLHEREHPGVVEPGQLDARDTTVSAECPERFNKGMGVGQLAVPIGPEYEYPHRAIGCGQVTQELKTSLVRPLQVIEEEDHRLMF